MQAKLKKEKRHWPLRHKTDDFVQRKTNKIPVMTC